MLMQRQQEKNVGWGALGPPTAYPPRTVVPRSQIAYRTQVPSTHRLARSMPPQQHTCTISTWYDTVVDRIRQKLKFMRKYNRDGVRRPYTLTKPSFPDGTYMLLIETPCQGYIYWMQTVRTSRMWAVARGPP